MIRLPAWTQRVGQERWTVRAGMGLAALVIAGAGVAVVNGGADNAALDAVTSSGADMTAPATTIPGVPALELPTRQPDGDDAGAAKSFAAPGTGGGVAEGGVAQDVAAPAINSVPATNQKVVKTASMSLEVGRKKLADAVHLAAVVAERHGGYVEGTSTSNASDDHASALLTVRVPADKFAAAREDLRGLGKVKAEEIRGDDVTDQLVDYDARIRSLQAQEEALRTLMSRASRVGEVLEVQNQLFGVRQQIEQLNAQRAQLDKAASLATLTVNLFEPGAAISTKESAEPKTGLARSWEQATDGTLAVIGGMLIVIGYGVPIAILAALVWGLSRLRRRPAAVAAATPPVS